MIFKKINLFENKKILLIFLGVILLVLAFGGAGIYYKQIFKTNQPEETQKVKPPVELPAGAVVKIKNELIYKEDFQNELLRSPSFSDEEKAKMASDVSTLKEKFLNKILRDSLILQGAASESLVTLTDDVYNSPSKDYRKRMDLVSSATEKLIEKKVSKITAERITLYFYNTNPPSVGLEKAKEMVQEKMGSLREKLVAGELDMVGAGETIKKDTTLSKIDPAYKANAYFKWKNLSLEKKTYSDPGLDKLVKNAKVGKISEVLTGKARIGEGEAFEAYLTIFKVESRQQADFDSFDAWLKKEIEETNLIEPSKVLGEVLAACVNCPNNAPNLNGYVLNREGSAPLKVWVKWTDALDNIRYTLSDPANGGFYFESWQNLSDAQRDNYYNTWIVPDNPDIPPTSTPYGSYTWARQSSTNSVNAFGCGENPHVWTAVKPASWSSGSFTLQSGDIQDVFANDTSTLNIGTIWWQRDNQTPSVYSLSAIGGFGNSGIPDNGSINASPNNPAYFATFYSDADGMSDFYDGALFLGFSTGDPIGDEAAEKAKLKYNGTTWQFCDYSGTTCSPAGQNSSIDLGNGMQLQTALAQVQENFNGNPSMIYVLWGIKFTQNYGTKNLKVWARADDGLTTSGWISNPEWVWKTDMFQPVQSGLGIELVQGGGGGTTYRATFNFNDVTGLSNWMGYKQTVFQYCVKNQLADCSEGPPSDWSDSGLSIAGCSAGSINCTVTVSGIASSAKWVRFRSRDLAGTGAEAGNFSNWSVSQVGRGWFQTQGGDVHSQETIKTLIPQTTWFFSQILDPSAGVVSYQNNNPAPDYGQGKVSSPLWQANSPLVKTKFTFSYYEDRLKDLYSPPGVTNHLITSCDQNPCELRDELEKPGRGLIGTNYYFFRNLNVQISNNKVIDNFTPPNKLIVLVDGNLTIKGKVLAPVGSFLMFIVKGDIKISENTVGDKQLVANPHLEGIYLSDKKLYTTLENENMSGNRLVARGVFVTGQNQGGFALGRDLKNQGNFNNSVAPAELFIFRPDFLPNMPEVFLEKKFTWQEIQP